MYSAAAVSLLLAAFVGFGASSLLSSSASSCHCWRILIVGGVSFSCRWLLVVIVVVSSSSSESSCRCCVVVVGGGFPPRACFRRILRLVVVFAIGISLLLLMLASCRCHWRQRRLFVVVVVGFFLFFLGFLSSASASVSASCCCHCIFQGGGGLPPRGCFPRLRSLVAVVVVGFSSSSLAMCCSCSRRRPLSWLILSDLAPRCHYRCWNSLSLFASFNL